MPVIGFNQNRRELYVEQEDTAYSGNRLQTIAPEPSKQIVEAEQIFRDKSIPASKIRDLSTDVDASVGKWSFDATFSSSDADTVAWSSGTLTVSGSDGVLATYSIDAGNTGNMSARTYIYLDIGTSTTVLQTTTTAATAVGTGKILICVAKNETGGATFQAFGGAGGIFILGDKIVANSITANQLSTSLLYAGSLTIDEGGNIKSGQTNYNTGSGWWIGDVGGVKKLSIGDGTTSNSLTWNGTSLVVNGRTFTADPIFGDGSDGDVTITADTTLTRDMFYDTLTINATGAYSETTSPVTGTSGDGHASNNGATATWATIRAAAGTASDSGIGATLVPKLTCSTTGFTLVQRAILPVINTVPADATILTAKIRVYVNSVVQTKAGQSISLVSRTDPGTISNDDYNIANWTMTKLASDIAIANVTAAAYNEFTLNATGIALLQAGLSTEITFGIVLTCDADNSDPGKASAGTQEASVTIASADSGANIPQLVVTYSRPTNHLYPNGYRIFAKTSITNNGYISRNGAAGGNGGNGGNGATGSTNGTLVSGGTAGSAGTGAVAGAAGAVGAAGQGRTGGGAWPGVVGSNANNGGAGSGTVSSIGSSGVVGASGARGGAGGNNATQNGGAAGTISTGGAAGSATAPSQSPRNLGNATSLYDSPNSRSYATSATPGGAGGGSGGGSGATYNLTYYGGSGGGGGGGGGGGAGYSGGVMALYSPSIINNGTIEALGGTGGNGGNGGNAGNSSSGGGTASASGSGGGGGGGAGAGGTGGVIVFTYTLITNNGTISVAAGASGAVGAGGNKSVAAGTGNTPQNGNDGNAGSAVNSAAGQIYYLQLI